MIAELAIVAVLLFAVIAACVLLRQKIHADRKLREAMEALPAGIGFYDKNDRLYVWNRAYVDVSGDCAKLLRPGVRFRDLLAEDLRCGHYDEAKGREDAWLDERLALRALGKGSREQGLRDGRWLRVQDRRTPDGGTVSIVADVTEIKTSEGTFKLMFDNNPVPMWLWQGGKSLRVIDLNQAALDHLGYSRADIARLTVFDLLSDDERPALNAMIASGMVRPYDGERVWRPRCADGSLRFAVPYIHRLPSQDGRVLFVGAIVDVTDRVLAERKLSEHAESLAKALDLAQTANRTKSEFLATMSHELRTPLNAIIGFSEIITAQMFGPLGNDRYVDYCRSINSSGAHLLGLINDILDISRLDAGKLELELEPVDLTHIVEECCSYLALQVEQKKLRIRCAVGKFTLNADRRRLKQMLLNLVSNAIKFTPDGGEIRIWTAQRPDGLALAVTDTGIGMASEDIPKALERFGQIDSSLSRKYEGTGLGLPLTKQLAELHGATLTLESARGAGTTATIVFPVALVLADGQPSQALTG